ncbi:MAG: Methylcobalamin:coenzyme M methyltransferase MtbA [Candidatus Methanohalarchaeum thermophilum]|uniref:Methylcobalamin:coenzyme M methyltransferase MtbA n=1 Tax=Methanohalarchaeum thermophilum TaxID=1903181 RepID=A0A1Q6DX50_METT1|nr:MAG: Methylcobalamin:coenzyme M methyltransferase MtbA [Candidatus Methanohalarchaeum thermophilum]
MVKDFAPLKKESILKRAMESGKLLQGETPSRVPVNPIMLGQPAKQLFNEDLMQFYKNPRWGVRSLVQAHYIYDTMMFPMWLYADYWIEDYGGKLSWPTSEYSQAPSAKEPAFETKEEVEEFEVMAPEDLAEGPTMQQHWKALDEAKKILGDAFIPWSFPYGMFTVAGNLVDPNKLTLWVRKDPSLVHTLLEKYTQHAINVNTIVAEKYGGPTFIATGSILGSSDVLSKEQNLEFNIKYLKEMVEKSLNNGAGPFVWYHLCGDHSNDWKAHDIVPSTEASIMHVAYDGDDPADIKEVVDYYGDDHIIMGNVDTTLLRYGSPKEVYEASKEQVKKAKDSPKGFMLGPACETPPNASITNVEAMVRAAKDHGEYE